MYPRFYYFQNDIRSKYQKTNPVFIDSFWKHNHVTNAFIEETLYSALQKSCCIVLYYKSWKIDCYDIRATRPNIFWNVCFSSSFFLTFSWIENMKTFIPFMNVKSLILIPKWTIRTVCYDYIYDTWQLI